MNRKSILILAGAVLLILALIGVAVHALYSGVPEGDDAAGHAGNSELLAAVPSDAAAVFSFSDIRKGVNFLSDPSGMFSGIFSRTRSPKFISFLGRLKDDGVHGARMAVSMHFSGNLEPLMIIDAGRVGADTSSLEIRILAAADSAGLNACISEGDRKLLLVSASETLIGNSVRHIDGGTSILDDSSFASALGKVKGENAMYVSHDYAPQLVATYLDAGFRKYSDFLKRFSDWTALDIMSAGGYRLQMQGASSCGRSDSFFLHVLEKQPQGGSHVNEILPEGTTFSAVLTDEDFKQFNSSFSRYLDASAKLSSRKRRLDTLTADGLSPLQWREKVSVREVARVEWNAVDTQYVAVFVRTGEKSKGKPEVVTNAYRGFVPALYGDIFAIKDESSMVSSGNWTAFGGAEALSDWIESGRLNVTFPSEECVAAIVIPPMTLQWTEKGVMLNAEPVASLSSQAEAGGAAGIPASASVERSNGPFKVHNCGTGKINELYQNDKLYICLRDENGRGMWGVPVGERICGCVAEVDHFRNGKIQFLFCAGSEMCLVDRLGRFVSGFPVSLGKEVLVGPAVYDFNSDRKYSVMVLHSDNTVGVYDMSGKAVDWWNGMISKYAFVSLPELIEYEGVKYWTVETSAGQTVYEFGGGEPLKGKVARKIIAK